MLSKDVLLVTSYSKSKAARKVKNDVKVALRVSDKGNSSRSLTGINGGDFLPLQNNFCRSDKPHIQVMLEEIDLNT